MNLKQIFAVFLLTMGITAHHVQADTLNMKSIGAEPPNSAEGILRPGKGMTMDQVLQKFGEPATRHTPVGEPPITRWVYDKFTVYFEHQYVIHSAVHRETKMQK